jgi:hypothetical protein
MDDADEDLYGDLAFSATPHPTNPNKRQLDTTSTTTTTTTMTALLTPSSTATTATAQLRAENAILKANMSTLYRTAKAELDRKDKEITRLSKLLEESDAQLSQAAQLHQPR